MKRIGLKTVALMSLGVLAMTASSALAAEVNVIHGDFIPDECEEAHGPGWEEVLNAKNELAGCECKFGWEAVCGQGSGFSWNGDGVVEPPDPGGGGGVPPEPIDECGDDDAQCTCEAEEAEAEPELCELSCGECENEKAACEAVTDKALASCETKNEKTAAYLCSKDTRSFYADVESCVYGKLHGFPGLSSGSYSGSTSGWNVSGKGGVTFDIGIAEFGAEAGAGHSWSTTHGSNLTVSYPPVPVDYTVFSNCDQNAGLAFMACLDGQEECNSAVEEQTGESCAEAPSSERVIVTTQRTASPTTSAKRLPPSR